MGSGLDHSVRVVTAPGAPTVVVLAGGRSSRFGSDKLAAPVGGEPLLDRLLGGLPGDWPVVLVGPARVTVRPSAHWTRESPPWGGPLAAVAAGMRAADSDEVVVVAGDMPWAGPVVRDLAAALREAPVAVAAVAAVDDDGHVNPLLAAYRRVAVLDLVTDGGSDGRAKRLLSLPHRTLRVPGAPGRDVDVPSDLDGVGPGD